MKKLLALCLLLVGFVNANSQTYNSAVVNLIDGNITTVLTNEIDSITYSNLNSQDIWTKDSIYRIPLSSINSTDFEKFELTGVLIKNDNLGIWSEMRIATDGSLMMIKQAANKEIPEDLVMILRSDDLGVLYSYTKFDENGMPKSITINDCIIIVDAYYDSFVDMTIVYNDTIAYSVDSLTYGSSSSREYVPRRSWGENNWQRNVAGIVELASGVAGVVGGALLVTGSVVSEAGSFGASTPISIPGILAGTATIGGGVSTFKSGWDKLFIPGEYRSNVGETIYYQGASELISNGPQNTYVPEQYWAYMKDPNYSKQLGRAGWLNFFVGLTAGIFDNRYGNTVTWEDITNFYQGKVVTGLNKDITTNSALVRGYVAPEITKSLLNGNKVSNEYGIILYSSMNSKERWTQKVNNGDGGIIEFTFDNLKPSTLYNYRVYYIDKTNGISLLGDICSFRTLSEPPTITNFEVMRANYYPEGFVYNKKSYKYKFECKTTVKLDNEETVEDWGYVYEDPDGNISHISVKEFGINPFEDERYAYYRNEPKSTAMLYGYVKYYGSNEPVYGEPVDYPLEYTEFSCPDENHPHMIDLGLPSGTKWACCNVGASSPEQYGNYFAWGETSPKSDYTEENYAYYNSNTDDYINIGSDIAGTGYDAATANWGSPWCMPSHEQCQELVYKCTYEWTTQNGVNGTKFTGPSGGTIFLPAAGDRGYDGLYFAGSLGDYWSSSLYKSRTDRVWGLGFYSGDVDTGTYLRDYGHSVRPVRKN